MKDGTYQYSAGNRAYKNDKSLNYLLFDEGLVTKTSSVYSYEYHLKDHLGNTRVTFQSNGSTTTTTQVAEYYPFGSSYLPVTPAGTNKYLYNGKEKQDDVLSGTALDWYDYGARFYDPVIGRWHTVDPLAEKYRRWSPYNYGVDNPMRFIDPDGMGASDFKDKDDNLVSHVDDGSNAVYQQTGSGTNLHYELKKDEYSDQGGKNEVTDKSVTSAIQEQQNLNMSNSSLKQDYNPQTQKYGGTHCNQATQNVETTAQSAINAQRNGKASFVTPGRANDIAKNLNDTYKPVTQAEAQTAASQGKLVIAAYQNPTGGSGHVATLSVGENIKKGTLANVGVHGSTGFVPIKGSSNAAFREEHIVKYYIPK